jgi:WD40 repeat protein
VLKHIENAFLSHASFPVISDDLTLVAASRYDPPIVMPNPVLVYDISGDEAELKYTIEPHHMATDIVFTADGSTLVVGDAMTNITMWDMESGELLREVTIDEDPFQGRVHLKFNADESVLYAVENKNGVFAFDPATLELVEPFAIEKETSHNAVLLSPDESLLLTGRSSGLMIYDIAEQARLEDESWKITGFATISRMGLNTDGSRLMTAVFSTNDLGIWDVESREQTGAVNDDYVSEVTFIDFHPDGDSVFVTHDGGVGKTWGLSGDEPTLLQTVSNSVDGRYSPDGGSLLTRNYNLKSNLVDVSSGEATELALSGSFEALALSPDGATVVGSKQGVLRWLDVAENELTNTIEDQPKFTLLDFSPDGSVLVGLTKGTVVLYDATSGEELLALELEKVTRSVAFTADGGQVIIAAGSKDDARIFVYDTSTLEIVSEIEPGGELFTFALSPDGTLLAAAVKEKFDHYLRVWDMESDVMIQNHEITKLEVFTALAFSPDSGTLAIGDAAGRTHLVPVTAQ